MSNYTVILLVDASLGAEVSADSAEEAMEKADEQVDVPTLCHHCSRELDVGDVVRHIVINNETGDETEFGL